jgi:hypothetical protein
MKILTTVLFMAFSVFTTSCDEDDRPSTNPSIDNSFYTKIDGEDYNPEFVNGFVVVSGNITISGSESNGKNVVLNFPISAKSSDTFSGLEFIASYDINDEQVGGVSSEGSITITSHNADEKRVSGVFNFIVTPLDTGNTNAYVFTEGAFDVTYSKIN